MKKITLIVTLISGFVLVHSAAAVVYLADDFSGAGIDPVKWQQRYDWSYAPAYPAGCGQDIVGGRLHQYASGHAVELLSQDTFPVTAAHISMEIEIPSGEINPYYVDIDYGDETSAGNLWFVDFQPGNVLTIYANVNSSNDRRQVATLSYSYDTVIYFDAWINPAGGTTVFRFREQGGSTQWVAINHYTGGPAQKLYLWSWNQSGANTTGAYFDNVLIDDAPAPSPGLNDFILVSSDLEVAVTGATGMAESIVSLQPSRLDLLPAARGGLRLYVKNVTQAWTEYVNQAISSELTQDANGVRLQYLVALENARSQVALVEVVYTLNNEKLGIKAAITFNQADSSQYEMGLLQPYDQSSWQGTTYVGVINLNTPGIGDTTPLRYASDINDTTAGTIWTDWRPNSYPQLTLERADRYYMFGYLDLGAYAIFTPNRENSNPALMISPEAPAQNQQYTFEMFYKVFPRPENSYPDALKWYLQNVYSSNPLTQGIVTLPENLPHKTLASPGGFSFCFPRFSMLSSFPDGLSPELAADEGFHNIMEDTNLDMRLTHYWFAGGRVREVYPEAGTENAQMVHDNVQHLQKKGIKVYMYFRQIYRMEDFYPDKPPYEAWIARDRSGQPILYSPPDTTWIFGDFANPDFVDWYIQDVKRTIELYNPDGVAWDMAWGDHSFGSSTNGSLHHGIMRVLYEIYTWLGQNYPEKRVIGNGSRGLPTQMYMDALVFEGSYALESTAAICKIFNNTLLNVGYAERHAGFFEHIHALMKQLAYGGTFGDRGYTMAWYSGNLRSQWDTRMGGLLESSAYLQGLYNFADFSALTSSTPLVTEEDALNISPGGIIGSAWADEKFLLLAIYNDNAGSSAVTVQIDKNILSSSYGQTNPSGGDRQFKVLGSNGQPVVNNTWSFVSETADTLTLQGNLGSKELFIITSSICGDHDYPYPTGDLNRDCVVDFRDFAEFAAHWIENTGF